MPSPRRAGQPASPSLSPTNLRTSTLLSSPESSYLATPSDSLTRLAAHAHDDLKSDHDVHSHRPHQPDQSLLGLNLSIADMRIDAAIEKLRVDDAPASSPRLSPTSSTSSEQLGDLPPELQHLSPELRNAIMSMRHHDANKQRDARRKAEQRALQAEQEKVKAEQRSIKLEHKIVEAEQAKRDAQEQIRQSKYTTLLECIRTFDQAFLVNMKRNVDRKDTRQISRLYQGRALPHTLSPDTIMHEQCANVAEWMRVLLCDYSIDAIADAPLASINQASASKPLKNEASFVSTLCDDIIARILDTVFRALAARIVELKADPSLLASLPLPQHNALRYLLETFPHIVWQDVQQGFVSSSDVPTCILSENQAAGSKNLDNTDSRDNSCFHPNTTQLRCDLFFTLREPQNDPDPDAQQQLTFHMAEVKAFNLKKSDKLRNFFLRHSESETEADSSSADDKPKQRWRTIDFEQMAKHDDADLQELAAISQCVSYIPAHRVPVVLLTTGLTNIFIWYDHNKHAPDPNAPVDMQYYVVCGPTDDVAHNAQPAWQPLGLLDSFVYSLLRGLDDAFDTTPSERVAWSDGLAESIKTVKQLGFFSDSGKAANAGSGDVAHSDGNDFDDNGSSDKHNDDRGQPHGHGDTDAKQAGGPGTGSGQAPTQAQGGSCSHQGGRKHDAVEKLVETSPGTGPQESDMVAGTLDVTNAEPGDTSFGSTASAASGASSGSSSGSSLLSTRLSLGSSATSATTASVFSESKPELADSFKSRPPPLSPDTAGTARGAPYFSPWPTREWDGTPHYLGRSTRLITRQWCSTACLIGLKYGLAMDPDCPNAALHCDRAGCVDHAAHGHGISASQVRSDIAAELRRNRIRHTMEPILSFHGTNSRLFRVLHPGRGYAFAAKAAATDASESLHYEHAKYERLWRGHDAGRGLPVLATLGDVALHVPVSLGVVEPSEEHTDVMYPMWNLGGQIEVCMTCNTFFLMSYHGCSLDKAQAREEATRRTGKSTWAMLLWMKKALAAKGVYHLDIAPRNLLWCHGHEALVAIDFEHAK